MKNKTLMPVSVFMICVLTALSVAACAKTAPEAAQATKAPIKIALITDYTGIAASQVAMTGWGAEDYFPWVNAKGGIDGHPISCEVIDSKYDVNLIRSTYKRLKDNICSISLDALSGGIAALQEDFIKDQMPNLMTTGLGPVLYPPGWIFTTFVPYDDRFAHFGDWVLKNWKETRKPRMAMFIGNVASCKIIDRATPYVESRGIEIVAQEYCDWQPTDTTDQWVRIRDSKPDFIFDALSTDMGKVALKDKFNLGLANIPEASFFGNTWQMMQTVAPEAYDGYMVYTDSAQWWETNNPGVKFSAELYHKNRQAGEPPLDQYILAIGSMMVWEKAIRLAYEAVGYEGLNGKAVYDHGWTKMKDFDGMKIFPPLTFSAERTRGNEYVRIIQMHKGKNPTALTDYEKAPWVMKVLAEEE